MIFDFLYKFYFKFPNFKGFDFYNKSVNKIIRLIIRSYFYNKVPALLKNSTYSLNTVKREKKVIISLTTFPGRIDTVWITLLTLLRQTYKADKIILWLAIEQFPDKKLPESLTKLEQFGLEIRWCEDLRSHKKYFFALQEFNNDLVLTFDDDFYYPVNVVENLIKLYDTNNNAICATRVHKITFTGSSINSYSKWKANYIVQNKDENKLFFTSGAGTLFPPDAFDKEVFNATVFKEKCFFADDIWLNIMAIKKGTAVITNNVFIKDAITVKSSQKESLVAANVFDGGNDRQLKDVCEYYHINI